MSDRLSCNTSSHCDLCTPGQRNWRRVRIGDDNDPGPRVAVCPVHDVAGPVDLLPESLRVALDRRHA